VKKVGGTLSQNHSELENRSASQNFKGKKGNHGNTVQVNRVEEKEK